MTVRIDLNADLGESFGAWVLGDDEAMLDVVTSANVACGFHAGDATTIRRTVAAAAARGVVVGAQVGYRDLAGFGRRRIDMAAEDLTADVLYQLGALEAMRRVAGNQGRLRQAARRPLHHRGRRRGAGQGGRGCRGRLRPVAAPPRSARSVLLRVASSAGLPVVAEAFADRGYAADGRLVPRSHPHALLQDPDEVAERVLRIVSEGTLLAVDGTLVAVPARSVCTHGDTPGAVALARAVRSRLEAAGVAIAPFVPAP